MDASRDPGAARAPSPARRLRYIPTDMAAVQGGDDEGLPAGGSTAWAVRGEVG